MFEFKRIHGHRDNSLLSETNLDANAIVENARCITLQGNRKNASLVEIFLPVRLHFVFYTRLEASRRFQTPLLGTLVGSIEKVPNAVARQFLPGVLITNTMYVPLHRHLRGNITRG